MKKLFLLLSVLTCFSVFGQKKGLEYTTKQKIADTIFGLLNPKYYGSALIDRSLTEDSILIAQIRGDYSSIASGYTWLQAYSDISVSYTDADFMLSDSLLLQLLQKFYFKWHIENANNKLIQPFGLLLHEVSKIDTNLYGKKSTVFINQNNQLKVRQNIEEKNIYRKRILKEGSLLELYGKHGFQEGTIVYAPEFISIGPNIELKSIQLDVGNGFQPFSKTNNKVNYHIEKDWQIGKAAVSYLLENKMHHDTLSFYLTTKTYKYEDKSKAIHRWDVKYFSFPGNTADIIRPLISWAVRYGCGNGAEIRRPIIIVPPYAPAIQTPFISFNKYWDQFDYKSVMEWLSNMGYDVIFVREIPGNCRLANAGDEIAKFIKYINQLKQDNYPNESWENIVIGYSAGGQQLRYALKKLEKEHMEGNGPPHHCRLYIPFDSPHWGANVPMFTQAIYNEFSTNILAVIGKGALNDPASRDMLMNHYLGSSITQSGHDYTITPQPTFERMQFMGQLMNSFNHQYTPMNDLRRSFPSFTRNVAVSTGNNEQDYTSEYGLYPGMKLFKQGAFIPSVFGPKIIDRKIFASKYSSNALAFERKDKMLIGGFIPVWRTRYYRTKWAYEWDMAQGGYKDLFYDGIAGATKILRNSGFFFGTKFYNSHVTFLPLVSALAINPAIWHNNNLYYNLKNEGLMYNRFDIQNTPKSNFFGYPHLGHPNNHFNITPFEAVFSDNKTYDHIKLQKSAENDVTMNNYLVYLRNFILNEVEAQTVYLQNKDMGINHAPNDNNFTYTAWYKAENTIIAGDSVTPKTDEGHYVIEPTANVTMYACNEVIMKFGFHAKTGSRYHAFIKCDPCKGPDYRPPYPPEPDPQAIELPNSEATKRTRFVVKNENENKIDNIRVYPNPTHGEVTIQSSPKNIGKYQIFNLQGQTIQQGTARDERSIIHLSKGTYILKWIGKKSVQTKKIIVL